MHNMANIPPVLLAVRPARTLRSSAGENCFWVFPYQKTLVVGRGLDGSRLYRQHWRRGLQCRALAEARREALVKFGADPDMLIAKGYGSADPIASNDTPEGRRRNRRIEYQIV